MERKLRGLRYAPSQMAIEMAEELPYASFKRALAIYEVALQDPVRAADIAFLGCNDRFFLVTYLLRRHDILTSNNPAWLYARCREVEAEPDDCLDLWARGHYKSTFITFGGIIQELLCDPELCVAIFSVDLGTARKFLVQIKEELEVNDYLKMLYGDVLYADPAADSPAWSKNGIVIKRQTNPKENSVDCYGLLRALPAGPHYGLRVYDDPINQTVITQTKTDQARKIHNNWQLSQNLGFAGDNRQWLIGTRYLYSDMYGYFIREKMFKVRLYAATHNGKLNGRPVFLKEEDWEDIKKKQRDTVAAQMLQNPTAGNESTFRMEHLRSYPVRPRLLNVYILVDPSGGRSGKSDRTAMIVIGIDANNNAYLLDGFVHRMRLSDRWNNLKSLVKKWTAEPGVQHVRVGYERYGLQSDDEYIQGELEREEWSFDLVEVSWTKEGNESKDVRIARLEPWFRNSRFWLPARIWRKEQGECLWYVDIPMKDDGTVDEEGAPDIVYVPLGHNQLTRAEVAALDRGETWRVMKPIKRRNESGELYDLTGEFMLEYLQHPFSAWRDIVDATSRIEDVDATPPAVMALKDLVPEGAED